MAGVLARGTLVLGVMAELAALLYVFGTKTTLAKTWYTALAVGIFTIGRLTPG
jgi:hypothetical protein